MSRWANQYLGVGGYPDHLITDLASDMADGITLLRLVQAVCKQRTRPHNLVIPPQNFFMTLSLHYLVPLLDVGISQQSLLPRAHPVLIPLSVSMPAII